MNPQYQKYDYCGYVISWFSQSLHTNLPVVYSLLNNEMHGTSVTSKFTIINNQSSMF